MTLFNLFQNPSLPEFFMPLGEGGVGKNRVDQSQMLGYGASVKMVGLPVLSQTGSQMAG